MRLFESVLATLTNLQRPQRKFLCHLMKRIFARLQASSVAALLPSPAGEASPA
jgi:hypothetical protein